MGQNNKKGHVRSKKQFTTKGMGVHPEMMSPRKLVELGKVEEGAIYRSSKVAKSIVFNEVPVTSFKIRSFWECFICDIPTMHA